jgi:hypothetical protein
MSEITLLSSTGNESIDSILQGFVGICELGLPGKIRGYYLTGSWSNGTALHTPGEPTRSSDIDMQVIFKGSLEASDRALFEGLLGGCQRICSLALEVYAADEEALSQNWDVCLKQESLLLYGEEIRDRIPLPNLDDHIQRTMTFPPYAMAAVRGQVLYAEGQWLEPLLRYPLPYPDPDGEFYGYDVGSSLGELVRDATWAATVLLALKAGRIAGTKQTAVRMYQELDDEEWRDLPAVVFEQCKRAWRLQVPEAEADRWQLRELCHRMLGLENHLLRLYRDYLERCVQSGNRDQVLFATRILGQVVYDEPSLLAALRRLAEGPAAELREAAGRALERMSRAEGL